MRRFTPVLGFVVLAAAVGITACSRGASSPGEARLYDPAALPTGALGKSIAYGHDIVVDTQRTMNGYVRARMNCAACHIDAGTKPKGGSFAGTYARFPQWNARAKRVIALQDRIAECFLYSMNGRPPAYYSREMVAVVAYIAWLSRGTPVGATRSSDGYIVPLPKASPNLTNGARLYAADCAACHGASGAGVSGAFPPLWGAASFNAGAGMAHLDRMTGFVHSNMPKNAPGSLSLADAYDVSAWVLTHHRPQFGRTVEVESSPRPAGYF